MSRKGFWGLSGSDCKKATNPCPCGFHGDAARECACTPPQIQHYRSRVSGPLLDRIDLHIPVPAVKYDDLARDDKGDDSAVVRERVVAARRRQLERLAPFGLFCNAQMPPRLVRRFCPLDRGSARLLEEALSRLGLSARAYDRILRVSRTIADLEGRECAGAAQLAEAIQYRSLDRTLR